jgi:hypothetical protein
MPPGRRCRAFGPPQLPRKGGSVRCLLRAFVSPWLNPVFFPWRTCNSRSDMPACRQATAWVWRSVMAVTILRR